MPFEFFEPNAYNDVEEWPDDELLCTSGGVEYWDRQYGKVSPLQYPAAALYTPLSTWIYGAVPMPSGKTDYYANHAIHVPTKAEIHKPDTLWSRYYQTADFGSLLANSGPPHYTYRPWSPYNGYGLWFMPQGRLVASYLKPDEPTNPASTFTPYFRYHDQLGMPTGQPNGGWSAEEVFGDPYPAVIDWGFCHKHVYQIYTVPRSREDYQLKERIWTPCTGNIEVVKYYLADLYIRFSTDLAGGCWTEGFLIEEKVWPNAGAAVWLGNEWIVWYVKAFDYDPERQYSNGSYHFRAWMKRASNPEDWSAAIPFFNPYYDSYGPRVAATQPYQFPGGAAEWIAAGGWNHQWASHMRAAVNASGVILVKFGGVLSFYRGAAFVSFDRGENWHSSGQLYGLRSPFSNLSAADGFQNRDAFWEKAHVGAVGESFLYVNGIIRGTTGYQHAVSVTAGSPWAAPLAQANSWLVVP